MGNFAVRLGIENTQFRRGIDQATSDVKRFKREASGMGAAFTALRGAIASLGLGMALREIVDRADQIKDLSDRFGVFSESLQKVGLVAEQNGSSLEAVARAMQKLEVSRDKAIKGDEDLIAKFEKLGVTMEDLKSLSVEQLMEKIGKSAMDASIMVDVMGKNALELRDTLALLDGAKVQGIIADEDIQALGELKDGLISIFRILQQIGAAMIGDVVRGLQDMGAMAAAVYEGIKAKFAGGNFMDTMKKVYADSKMFDTWKIGQTPVTPRIGEADGSRADLSGVNSARSRLDSAMAREQSARERMEEAATRKSEDALLQKRDKLKARMRMSGQEIAEERRQERRDKRDEARAERRLGKEQFDAIRDRRDPVKAAQREMLRAAEESNKALEDLNSKVEETNQILEEKLDMPHN